MRQKFKGKTLTTKRTVDNILKVYHDCEDMDNWYEGAHSYAQSLADSSGCTLIQAAGVIAALSPLKSWDENKRMAKSFLHGGRAKHTKCQVGKAKDILEFGVDDETILKILNGNKIKAFYINIAHPKMDGTVTIDRHALAVALGRNMKENEGVGITDKQYEFFSRCYRIAAEKVNTLAHNVQAVTWVRWREMKQEAKLVDVPF